MMKRETFAIADIYVPTKRRTTLEQKRVDEIAASMLDDGQHTPILVRADGARFVLVEGLHRLEAARRSAKKPSSAFLFPHGNTESPAAFNSLPSWRFRAPMTVPSPGCHWPAILAGGFFNRALIS